jgi:hypothetical protein
MPNEFYFNPIQISNDLTVTKNVSGYGIFYGDGSGLYNLSDSEVRNLSSDWDSVYTTVQNSSANDWDNSKANEYTHLNFLPLSGGTINGDLNLNGSLFVTGTAATINTLNLVLSDALIYLANDNNQTDLVDIGFVGGFNDGLYQHTGLVRTASDKKWVLFKGLTSEPLTSTNINVNDLTFSLDTLRANIEGTLTGNVSGNISGNAETVTNGVYTDQTYSDPNWILSLDFSKIINSNSENWDSVYTTVQISSAVWKEHDNPLFLNNAGVWDITYGNNRFVTVSKTNPVSSYISFDGVNWKNYPTPNPDFWYGTAIEYANGLFVNTNFNTGAGTGSELTDSIITSPDGINWTKRTIPQWKGFYGYALYDIAYGKNLFVIASYYDNCVLVSKNGIDWNRIDVGPFLLNQPSPLVGWICIAYGNDKFIMLGDAASAQSIDGFNWTWSYDIPNGYLSETIWKGIEYGNGIFVATGDANGIPVIATTKDGTEWSFNTSISTYGTGFLLGDPVYGNGNFIIPGISGTNFPSSSTAPFLQSKDGLSWSPIYIDKTSESYSIGTYGNGNFVFLPDGNTLITDGKSLVFDGNKKSIHEDIHLKLGDEILHGNSTINGTLSSNNIIHALGGNSNNWNSVYTIVQTNSASKWDNVYTTVQNFSATEWKNKPEWDSVYSTVQTNSASKWDNVYTTVQSSSALEWDNKKANEYTHLNFLPLSGGTVTGNLTAAATLFVGEGVVDFIVTEEGKVGIGTDTPNEKLTINGILSSNDTIYSLGGNSTNWNSVYTNVNSNSSFYIPSKTSLVNSTPSASAINNMVVLSQVAYESIVTKDPSTVYIII